MGHKYLKDLDKQGKLPWGIPTDLGSKDDKRREKWKEQRKKYGFDERETWSLNYTFYAWLYERLKMYLEKADSVVDLNFYMFTYKKETLTQKEWIIKLIGYCEDYLENPDTLEEKKLKQMKDIVNIWNMILPCMWW